VFVIIMATFAVPEEHQHKVLTFGIILALIMRAIFIAVGATLLSLFSFMFLLFGLLLIYTAIQLFRHRDEDPDVENNIMIRATRRVIPSPTSCSPRTRSRCWACARCSSWSRDCWTGWCTCRPDCRSSWPSSASSCYCTGRTWTSTRASRRSTPI
jgi:hypothetical protein